MTIVKTFRLLLAFVVVFSLSSLPGPLSSITFHLPSVRATPAPAQFWTPGGPSSNTFLASIFANEGTEYTSLLAQTIDIMDWPLTPSEINCLNLGQPPTNPDCPAGATVTPSNYYVTSPVSAYDEFEIEFNLANTGQPASATVLNSFWGIPMQFGNSLKGIHIRQGIDHLVDRASFVANEGFLRGKATTLDNPVPTSDGLVTPNACNWDMLFPQTGAVCAVGPSLVSSTGTIIDTGGTAYHLGGNTVMPGGVGVWQPGPGSPDLNAAASHFVAAGIATGFNSATSVLTGLNATAVANPPTFFIRNDNFPRLDLGTSIAEEICYLFTGSISLAVGSCAAGPGLNLQFIPAACGLICIPCLLCTLPNMGWGMYTAAFGGVFPFDSLLYFEYNSLFTDFGSGALTGTPCTSTTTSTSAPNYMYICSPAYDAISSQMEFAPCPSALGDPVPGQTTPTFATCQPGVSASTNGAVGTGNPDFSILPASVSLGTSLGVVGSLAVTLQSTNRFSGSVLLSVAGIPTVDLAGGVLNRTSVVFNGTGTLISPEKASFTTSVGTFLPRPPFPSHTLPGTYTFTLTAGTHTAFVSVVVPPLTAVSAGYQAEDLFGRMALTLPDYSQKEQFAYLSDYNIGVTNSVGAGIPQFFTWLNAWNPTPRAGTGQLPFVIRQGFKQTTTNVNPYTATTPWDFYILRNIYDSIFARNPFNMNQFFNWMTTSSQVICSPTSAACSSGSLGYIPPAGTAAVIRSVLKNGLKWQDGSPLNAWDIRFSYLTLKAAGSFQSSVEAPLLDVHMVSTLQFDFDLNAIGPFTQLTIGGPTIFPGHIWSAGASTWNAAASPTDPTMLANSGASGLSRTNSGARFDPLAAGLLIGSGGWTCANAQPAGTPAASLPLGQVGTGCSNTDNQAPGIGGTITLTRSGCTLSSSGTSCGIPGTSPYFRSSASVASWIWSGMNGNFIHDFVNLSGLAACFGKPAGTTGCGQWQSGIGNPGDAFPSFPCTANHCIGLAQYATLSLLFSVSFVAVAPNAPGQASDWCSLIGVGCYLPLSPSGDGVPAPVLYEGQYILNPCSLTTAAYVNSNPSAGGYDC